MIDVTVNLMAVVAAAVVQMVLGFFWYSPALFGKQWMGYMGKTEEEIKSGANASMYTWMALVSLVTAYVLAHFVQYTDSTALAGMQTGFWLWLGFVATYGVSAVLFEGRPRGLYYINMGYQVVALVLMGALLAVWGA